MMAVSAARPNRRMSEVYALNLASLAILLSFPNSLQNSGSSITISHPGHWSTSPRFPSLL